MRRALVLFLILLFPLNVLALTTSLVQYGHAAQRPDARAAIVAPADAAAAAAAAGLAAALDCDTSCDIDPDEPPAAGDLHAVLNEALRLQPAALSGTATPPADAARHRRAIPPPVKPPRVA